MRHSDWVVGVPTRSWGALQRHALVRFQQRGATRPQTSVIRTPPDRSDTPSRQCPITRVGNRSVRQRSGHRFSYGPGMGHLLGYARVSTLEQQPALQHDALTAAGCERVFTDHASGALDARPMLAKVLDQLLPGDTLVVWRLDRLGRSMSHLIATVTELQARGVGFRSLQESIDTTTATGTLIFHMLAAVGLRA